MRMRTLCCAAVLVFSLLSVSAASAATWSAQNMAIPQTVQGALFSVSCGATNTCEGVGQTVDAQGNTRAVAEGWNGSSWKTHSAPSVDGPITYLGAVSCAGPSSCLAVGSYQTFTTGGMLAERWDGSAWTVQFLKSPAGATGVLNAVSCGTPTDCTAVGFEFNNQTGNQVPLVEVWNGLGWRAQTSPNPAGAVAAALTGVSCTSATACTAVGSYLTQSFQELSFAQSRVGSAWQLQALATPEGALTTFVSSVSCSAADACTLVGTYLTGSQQLGLAERWNGFAWAQQTVPTPGSRPFMILAGVSCSSASACTAVGGAASQTKAAPVAVVWNGTKWKVQPTPEEPGGFLGAVSCAAANSCTAVGAPGLASGSAALGSGAGGLRSRATGLPGAALALPPGATSLLRPGARSVPRPGLLGDAPRVSSLGAAAAAKLAGQDGATGLRFGPAGTLGAAGRLGSSAMYRAAATLSRLATAGSPPSASLTLVEHWDGNSWTVQPTPGFTGAAFAQAIGVSCGSPTMCFATGLYDDNSVGKELPLLEQYNGTRWSIQPIPAPAGAFITDLFDVSCSAANACTAVGEAVTAATEIAFADRWDGTSWTLQMVPGQPPLGSALGSVSCTSATACTAVGALLNNTNGTLSTLAEFWNGSKWTIQPTPNKTGNTSSALYGVSCTSADACMSAGNWHSNTSFAQGALTEVFSGGTWQLKNLPALPNAATSLPDPVSCSAADACTAVGSWASRTGGGAFADSWNGKRWASQPVPTSLFFLEGVSCLNTTACLATGGGTSAVWNGISWTVQPLAPPPVGNFPDLPGVSCSAATAECIGVGSAFTGQPIPVAEGYS
jgi:hypothetical protein